jgi:hypothetical protein
MPRPATRRDGGWRDKTWRDAGGGARPLAGQIRRVQEWLALPAAWFEARDARRRLMDCHRLDARFAKDIGLTPGEIEAGRIDEDWRGIH